MPHDHLAVLTTDDVLAAPTAFSAGDISAPLTLAQQVEWLLRVTDEDRGAYLHSLEAEYLAEALI